MNNMIREKCKEAGVHLWQVAYRLGMSDSSFSRKLRRELSDTDRAKVLAVIDELEKEEI